MLKKLVVFAAAVVINVGMIFIWVLSFLFTPVGSIVMLALGLIVPHSILSASWFQGNIAPFLGVPFMLFLNYAFFSRVHYFRFNPILLSVLTVLFAFGSIFIPPIIVELLTINSEIKNFHISGQPTFVLEQSPSLPGYLGLRMHLPVNMSSKFHGHWMPNYFQAIFNPSSTSILENLPDCKLFSSFLSTQNLQPQMSSKYSDYTAAGNYDFIFEFNFQGSGCLPSKFIGEKIELLNISSGKNKPIETYTISSLQSN